MERAEVRCFSHSGHRPERSENGLSFWFATCASSDWGYAGRAAMAAMHQLECVARTWDTFQSGSMPAGIWHRAPLSLPRRKRSACALSRGAV